MKRRAGAPVDEPADVAAGGWAGHVPLVRVARTPVTAEDARGPVPEHVMARAAALGADVRDVAAGKSEAGKSPAGKSPAGKPAVA
jgi:hypothetical protein